MAALATIGRFFLGFFAQTGTLSLFVAQSLAAMARPPIYWRMIGQQIMRIGYYSLPVVALTSFFTGGALAIQINSTPRPLCLPLWRWASRASLALCWAA